MKSPFKLHAFTSLCACGFVLGCGGGGGSSSQDYSNASLTLSPVVASVAVGGTQQFNAALVETTGAPFWSVAPSVSAGAGTITQTGLYTAPAAPPVINYGGGAGQQGVVTISATSLYPKPGTLLGATVGDSETFVITAPSITVGITPATVTVPLGAAVKFQPYAVGSLNRGYTLQVNGITGGSSTVGTIVTDNINAGLYTAPAAMPMTGSTVTITVISQADPTKTGKAVVTLQ